MRILMHQLLVNYERLRRRVESCEQINDQIELFELSHNLRLWTESKQELSEICSDATKHLHFKTASPSKAASKILKSAESVFCAFPQPVRTKAHNGDMSGVPLDAQPDGSVYNITLKVKLLDEKTGEMEGSNFCVVKRNISEDESKKLSHLRVTRCNYTNWLGSEIVRVSYVNDSASLVTSSLSREKIIKRMANAFGGSHAWNTSNDYANSSDRIVRELFKHQVMGIPLPYLILLNIGQCILKGFEKYVVIP